MRLTPANLFGFKLIFCGGLEAVCCFWCQSHACWGSLFCFLLTGLRRMNTELTKQLLEELETYWVSWNILTKPVTSFADNGYDLFFLALWKIFFDCVINVISRCLGCSFCICLCLTAAWRIFFFPLSLCSQENPSTDAPDYTWRKTLVSVGTNPPSESAHTPTWSLCPFQLLPPHLSLFSLFLCAISRITLSTFSFQTKYFILDAGDKT